MADQAARTCEWREDEDGLYNTACGNTFEFTDGGLSDNECFKFCCYCGAAIVGFAYVFDDGESDAEDR